MESQSAAIRRFGKLICSVALTLAATSAVAQQTTFPFLQDGGARSAFVGGSYRSCLERQKTTPENASLSVPELGAFCLCYGRAIADIINGAEYEALALGKIPDSFSQKQVNAGNICVSRMAASQQPQEDKARLAMENRCIKEFHPEDTDYAAAQVRDRYCRCYSSAVTSTGREAKSPRDAADYCSQRMGPGN